VQKAIESIRKRKGPSTPLDENSDPLFSES
jgi:hypothetical protein